MRTILLSLFIMTSYALFCQESFKTGYIVNNNKDTVHGYIKEDVEDKLVESINFKDQKGFFTTLSVKDIKSFGFDNGNSYRLVNYVDPIDSLKTKVHFAKFLLEGTYQLFSFRRKEDLYFIVMNTDTSYFLYDDVRTQLGEVEEKGNYQSMLYFFARKCSKLGSTADGINFSEEALLSFFVSLEKCIGNANSIVHYSKSKAKKNIILSAGGLQWDKRTEMSIQALMQFVLPSVSRKTSLLTGLVYLRNTHESTETFTLAEVKTKYSTQIFEIPVLFRYDILQKMIQPYVYGGAGVTLEKDEQTSTQTSLISPNTEATGTSQQSSFGGTVIVGGGINIRIAKGLFVNLDWRYDLISHLPVAGLGYKISLK